MPRYVWTEEKLDEVRRLAADPTKSRPEMAKELGMKRQALYTVMMTHHIPYIYKEQKKLWTEERLNALRKAVVEFNDCRKLAKMFNIKETQMYAVFRQYNIPYVGYPNKRHVKEWTDQDTKWLTTNYPYKTVQECMIALNRSKNEIKIWALRLKLSGARRKVKNAQKERIILYDGKKISEHDLVRLYNQYAGVTRLSRHLNITPAMLTKLLIKQGVKITKEGKFNGRYGCTPAFGSKSRGIPGWYKGIHFRSLPEVMMMICFSIDNIKWDSAESFSIPYTYEGREYTYHPDFITANSLIEIKPTEQHLDPKVQAKAAAAEELCKEIGIEYILTDISLDIALIKDEYDAGNIKFESAVLQRFLDIASGKKRYPRRFNPLKELDQPYNKPLSSGFSSNGTAACPSSSIISL